MPPKGSLTSARSRSSSGRPPSSDSIDISASTSGKPTDALLPAAGPHSTPWEERGAMALLVLLYALQGIPLGLTTGALPFMLQSKLSYTQMGIFSAAAYPYSFKLFWSPLVDSVFRPAWGRRKTWIVPVQLLSAALLVAAAPAISAAYDAADVTTMTIIFFAFVMLAATQDIAVDGWALSLLSPANVGYASTCQTIGMNIGYFTSFTLFLALNNAAFCNTYIREAFPWAGLAPSEVPIVTLKGYLQFWGWVFMAVTLLLALLKTEKPLGTDTEEDVQLAAALAGGARGLLRAISGAYWQLWQVARLPAVWGLTAVLLTYRLGVMPAESAASLKLLQKGVSRETIAFLVLFQFPVDMASAVLAGRWAASHSPAHPYLIGYFLRLACAAASTYLAATFPAGAASFSDALPHFALLTALGLLTSFTSTLMFTALGSLFNQISDPAMGGAYLTLLNTIANMGIILPRTPMFWAMDRLTRIQCQGAAGACPTAVKDVGDPSECRAAGGVCEVAVDGFYVVSWGAVAVGLVVGLAHARVFPVLLRLPLERWRAGGGVQKGAKQS